MNYFIFDLDNTLFTLDHNNLIKNIVSGNLLEKLKKKGKIILFSNATYSYCLYWLDILRIKNVFSVIISSDFFNGFKPNPLLYKKMNSICGISSNDNVYFFDDIEINLESSKNTKWTTILINNKTTKKKYIDYNFNNINVGIEYILFNLDF
jgi:FMN phosphatase YigB (HAD superfamily)